MFTALYIYWGPGPYINLGSFSLRWYSLLFALGLLIVSYGIYGFFKRERAPMADFSWLMLYTLVFGMIGARLAHVFFYDWAYFKHHLNEIPLIWQGGLASHGAALGAILATLFYCRFQGKVYYWWVFDRLALLLPIWGALIRLGNMLNSELVGTPTTLPWAFVYTHHDMLPRHPVHLYEVLYCIIALAIMWGLFIYKRSWLRFGTLSGIFWIVIGLGRFTTDFFKEKEIIAFGLNTGQLLTVPFIVLGIVLVHYSQKGKYD